MVFRRAEVDRSRTPQQVIDDTGRDQSVNNQVVAGMPKGRGEQVGIYFFPIDRPKISDDDLQREFDFRDLRPDPYALSAVIEADPAFADERNVGTHWKGLEGKWSQLRFGRWMGKRQVTCGPSDRWYGKWWFAGVKE